MKIGSLFNICRRSPLGSRSSEWAQPSPRAFAILEFGKGFVIPVKAPFTQDAESAAKHMHFNGLRRELRAAVKVQNSSTFSAANRNVQNKRRNQNGWTADFLCVWTPPTSLWPT